MVPPWLARFPAQIALLAMVASLPLLVWPLLESPAPLGYDLFFLHFYVESGSFACAALIFATGWSSQSPEHARPMLWLSCAFLVVMALGLGHVLLERYQAPLTRARVAVAEDLTNLVIAAGLLGAALLPARPFRHPRRARSLLLAGAGLLGLLAYRLLAMPEESALALVTRLNRPDADRWLDYGMMALALLAAGRFFRLGRRESPAVWGNLCAAAVCAAVGGLLNLRYGGRANFGHLLEHLYGLAAFLLIYRAVFLDGVRRPYQQLYDAQAHLHILAEAVEQNPSMVVITDPELRIVYVNPQFTAATGYTLTEACGQTPRALLRNAISDADFRWMLDTVQRGGAWRGEFRCRRKSGEAYWETATISAIRDEAGAIRYWIAVKRDITAQKQAEQTLQRQIVALRASMDGMAVLDESGRYLFLNDAHVRVYGYDRAEELLGQTWEILYDEDERNRLRQDVLPLLQRDGCWRGEAVGRRRDGGQFPQEVSLSLVEGGGLVCVVRDITARRRAEQTLRATEARQRALLQAMPDMMFRLDFKGTFLDCHASPTALPSPPESLLGRRLQDCGLEPEPLQHLLDAACRALESGQVQTVYHTGVPAEESRHYETRIVPGGDREIVAIVRDVTEPQRIARQLQDSQAQLQAIYDGLSDGIVLADANTRRIVRVNAAACALFGYPEPAFLRLAVQDLHPAEASAAVEAHFAALADGRRPVVRSIPCRRADGAVFVADIGARTIHYAGGATVVGFFHDMTEHHRMTAALAAERNLFVGGPTLVFRWRNAPGWPVDYVSPNIAQEFGYAPAQLTDGEMLYADLVHPDDLARVGQEVVAYSGAGRASFEQEYRLRRADGEYRWVYDFTVVTRAPDGAVDHYRGYILDTTHLKRTELHLQQRLALEQVIGQVSSAIARASSDLLEDALIAALAELGRFVEADRSYLFLLDETGERFDNSHEWCADGVIPQRDLLQNLRVADFAWTWRELRASRAIHVRALADLPADAAPEKAILAAQDIESWMVAPLTCDGTLLGFFGFDRVLPHALEWNDADLGLLRTAADILAGALIRQRIEAASRLRERYLRAILDNSPHWIWLKDTEGRYLTVNQNVVALFGQSDVSAVLGKTDRDFFPADPAERFRATDRQIQRDGRRTIIEERLGDLWLETFKSPVFDDRGVCIATTGSAHDITARKEAELALRDSESRLRLALRAAQAGVWEWCPVTGRTFWSEENYRVMGLQPGQVLPSYAAWFSALHPGDRDRVQSAVDEMMARRLPHLDVEFRVVHPDGQIRWLRDLGEISYDARGQPQRMAGVQMDITARKEAELALRDRLRYEGLLNQISSDALKIADPDDFLARSLQLLGEALEVSRTYLYEPDPATGTLGLRCQWVAPGIEPLDPASGGLAPDAAHSWCLPKLRDGEIISREDIETLPLEGDRRWLRAQGVRSVLLAPLAMTDGFQGLIGFGECRSWRHWSLEDAELLGSIARVIVGALERQRAEDALRHERAFLQAILDGVSEPVVVIGEDYRILLINRALLAFAGTPPDPPFCYRLFHDELQPCGDACRSCPLDAVRRTGHAVLIEHEHRNTDGEWRWMEISAAPLWCEDGGFRGLVSSWRDVTERKRAQERLLQQQEQLTHQAQHDSLTGLPNRLLFQDRLRQALARANRHGTRVGLLFLDLDRFKPVNDRFGHDIGDRVLQETAKRLSGAVRAEDTVARLGGDEFTVILERPQSAATLAEIAAKLVATLQQPFQIEQHQLSTGASIGISLYPDDAADADALIQHADSAMYTAKQHGRDNYRFFASPTPQKPE